jgi:hypothetical protein
MACRPAARIAVCGVGGRGSVELIRWRPPYRFTMLRRFLCLFQKPTLAGWSENKRLHSRALHQWVPKPDNPQGIIGQRIIRASN